MGKKEGVDLHRYAIKCSEYAKKCESEGFHDASKLFSRIKEQLEDDIKNGRTRSSLHGKYLDIEKKAVK